MIEIYLWIAIYFWIGLATCYLLQEKHGPSALVLMVVWPLVFAILAVIGVIALPSIVGDGRK